MEQTFDEIRTLQRKLDEYKSEIDKFKEDIKEQGERISNIVVEYPQLMRIQRTFVSVDNIFY